MSSHLPRPRLTYLAAALVVLLATACDPIAGEQTSATDANTGAPTSTAQVERADRRVDVEKARQRLRALPTVERTPASLPAYDRDLFGSAWSDTDHNGCNQRDDVLLRDAVEGTVKVRQQGRCDHDVLAGTWHDPYTDKTLTFTDLKDLRQAQAIQIDHVVPLSEAWRSGASTWSEDRRRAYANDLRGLLAVDGPANAAKGDDDPAAWRPRKAFQCRYAVRWITVKRRWNLGVDGSERRALGEMLDFCSNRVTPAPRPSARR